ncbi:MAG: AhpC/TSA family protein [Bacteroidales bacterium]|nr:AhpC/TSA family protein [Bacteroidales bacterium]
MNLRMTLLSALLFVITGCRGNKVEISGKLENPVQGTYIFLDELKANELVTVDSVILSDDGNFYFQRVVKHPSFYLLKINQNNFLTMLFEPGENIKISALYDSLNYPLSITGSEGTASMVGYNRKLRSTINKIRSLSEIYRSSIDSPDLPEIINSLDSLAQEYLNEINTFTKGYIDENLSSLVSLIALYQQIAPGVYVLNPEEDFEYFKRVDSAMYNMYPDYDPVVSLHRQVLEMAAGFDDEQGSSMDAPPAMTAPEIALPGPQGDTIRLSSTRGAIVLLDFWAAWCAPCRKENPNLVEAYNLYHKKGFQIYQVSLDKSREAWLKGISDDNLGRWIHVSDVKYWNSMVVPLYKISSIPYNLLLDEEGRVIATNLRGNALLVKLAEVFSQK